MTAWWSPAPARRRCASASATTRSASCRADDAVGPGHVGHAGGPGSGRGQGRALAGHRPGGRAPEPHRHHPDGQFVRRRAGRLWRGDGLEEAQGHLGHGHGRVSLADAGHDARPCHGRSPGRSKKRDGTRRLPLGDLDRLNQQLGGGGQRPRALRPAPRAASRPARVL